MLIAVLQLDGYGVHLSESAFDPNHFRRHAEAVRKAADVMAVCLRVHKGKEPVRFGVFLRILDIEVRQSKGHEPIEPHPLLLCSGWN